MVCCFKLNWDEDLGWNLSWLSIRIDCGKESLFPGYLVVIHDLDLISMCEDLAGFKPNMYRLMQLSGKVVLYILCVKI